MKAADIMTSDVVTIDDAASVIDAARLLLQHRISALPVVDRDGRLVGIVSEGDLMRRAETGTERRRSWWLELLAGSETLAGEYVKSHANRVADVMTRKVVTAAPDAELGEIANLLERNGIKRVPIVDGGKVVGIVSRANLVQALAAGKEGIAIAGRPDDARIRERILARLKAEPWRPFMLNVVVHDGEVDLWGMVDSLEQKRAARVAAEGVPGVTAVKDNLVIRPATGGE